MPNFTVRDVAGGRFAGEFAVAADGGRRPTEPEKAYLAKLDEVFTRLAEDQRQDGANRLEPRLAAARVAHATATVTRLRGIADDLARAAKDGAAALRETEEAAQAYARERPDLAVRDKGAAEQRFAGDFAATPTNYQLEPAETAYVNLVARMLDDLADDEAADKAAQFTVARLAARQQARKDAAGKVRRELESYRGNTLSLDLASNNVLVCQGRYAAERDRLARRLFEVDCKMGAAGTADAGFAVDLDIRLTSGLPPPDDQPSKEQQELFVDLGSANTVIGTVCQHMHDHAEKCWTTAAKAEAHALARRLLDQYVRKLAGIARVGLQEPHAGLAKLALNELRAEFTARQAGHIKNTYVRSLGVAAALSAGLLLIAYVVITRCAPTGWWHVHKAFLIAAAGSSIGTWLSFSIRRVGLSFADLAILEEDLLDPAIRILFVIGLTITACLMFWTGVMNIEIGDLKTNPGDFMNKGSIAMLVGIFFGISERALATAISGRAAAFVRGIGG